MQKFRWFTYWSYWRHQNDNSKLTDLYHTECLLHLEARKYHEICSKIPDYLQRISVKIVSFFLKDVFSFFSQVTHVLETINADFLVMIVFEIPKLAFLSAILGNFADWAGFQFLILLHQLLSVKFATEAKSLLFETHFSSLNSDYQSWNVVRCND